MPQELTGDGSLSYCTVHFVDVDANREALIDVGVSSTPALMVYVAGNPVTIDRPGLEPDTKCTCPEESRCGARCA